MKIHPYLIFEGNCGEAFRFYQQVLGGKLDLMKMSDSPMADQAPPEQKDLILHASLENGDLLLMGSDNPTPNKETPGAFLITLETGGVDEAERMFAALSDGGEVTMPMEKTFFAERFGMLRDQFGMPWQVMCD